MDKRAGSGKNLKTSRIFWRGHGIGGVNWPFVDKPLGGRFCAFWALNWPFGAFQEAQETQTEPSGATRRHLGASKGRETTPEGLEWRISGAKSIWIEG